MKKLFFIPFLILALASCELLKEATQIDFGSNFGLSFMVDLDSTDNAIYEEEIIDLTQESEFNKYKDNIDEVKLDSVVISIENYDGPDVLNISGSLGYSGADETSATTFAELTNLDIANLFNEGNSYKVGYNESEEANIANTMINDQKIKVYLEGTASEVPVQFDLNVKIYTTVVAQPLD